MSHGLGTVASFIWRLPDILRLLTLRSTLASFASMEGFSIGVGIRYLDCQIDIQIHEAVLYHFTPISTDTPADIRVFNEPGWHPMGDLSLILRQALDATAIIPPN